jgi:hypothetical protein
LIKFWGCSSKSIPKTISIGHITLWLSIN